MKEKNKLKREEKTEADREKEETVVSEELIRWMTEGTDANHTPRSDCG